MDLQKRRGLCTSISREPARPKRRAAGVRRFRAKLLRGDDAGRFGADLGWSFSSRNGARTADAQSDLQRDFELELGSLHRLQDLRNAAVADRSQSLAQNARIHAALEDNALDLLYPSAHEELRELMDRAGTADRADGGRSSARPVLSFSRWTAALCIRAADGGGRGAFA